MKQDYLLEILKPYVSIENIPFPLDIDLFNEESQCVLSLLCQFSGLDSVISQNKFILKVGRIFLCNERYEYH